MLHVRYMFLEHHLHQARLLASLHTHELLDYESIARTMCHELAHCAVGPHNAKFYKVMEEIEEQYALFLARDLVLDRDGFPMNNNDAYRLGGGNVSLEEGKRRAVAAAAAEKRRGLSTSGGQMFWAGKRRNFAIRKRRPGLLQLCSCNLCI